MSESRGVWRRVTRWVVGAFAVVGVIAAGLWLRESVRMSTKDPVAKYWVSVGVALRESVHDCYNASAPLSHENLQRGIHSQIQLSALRDADIRIEEGDDPTGFVVGTIHVSSDDSDAGAIIEVLGPGRGWVRRETRLGPVAESEYVTRRRLAEGRWSVLWIVSDKEPPRPE